MPMRTRRFLPLLSALRGTRERLDRVDNPFDVWCADSRVDRELEEARDHVLGDWAAAANPKIAECFLLVKGHRVRRPAADAVLGQTSDDLVTGDRERILPPDDVLVIRVNHPIPFRRREETVDPF